MPEKCQPCRMGLSPSLLSTLCVCNQGSKELNESIPSPTDKGEEEEERGSEGGRLQVSRHRSQKRDAALKDQQSTGRKRAARQYPLDRDAACEWQGYADCGGGRYPIIGCVSGKQQSRHHGPDKSTSNNDEGNVHRICHRCHNRWHAANNAEYDWNETRVKPHRPRIQTDAERQEAILDELKFRANKEKNVRD